MHTCSKCVTAWMPAAGHERHRATKRSSPPTRKCTTHASRRRPSRKAGALEPVSAGGVIGNRKRFPAAVFVELKLMPWVPSALVEEGEDYGWDLTPGVTVGGF